MRHLLAAALLALSLAAGAQAQTGAINTPYHRNSYVPATPSPDASVCKNDTRVWVNTNSGVYHLPGQRYYGNTKDGEYMCKKDADAAGYRMTKNGQ